MDARTARPDTKATLRLLRLMGRYSDWRMAALAGVLGFVLTLAIMMGINAVSVSLSTLSIALAAALGSLLAVGLVGALASWRIRRTLREQNMRLDGAINNMIQSLCMFDAQNRLLVWNEHYRAIYNIGASRIWRGATIRDLLDARSAAGTFPLDPGGYEPDLRAALKVGKTFTFTIALADGRIIAVVNQPMKGGGWVATHEDITERKRAERELEQIRSFLDTIFENIPTRCYWRPGCRPRGSNWRSPRAC